MSAPFGKQPTYTELVNQLTDLTAQLAKPLTLDDLPLADLRKQLIENGDPLDLSILALPGQAPNWRTGSVTLTWAAANAAAAATVTHGLDVAGRAVTPSVILLTPRTVPFGPAGEVIVVKATARTETTFTVNAESNNAVTGAVTVDWLVIA